MALFVAVKFSQEQMPVTYDPGLLQDLKPQDFVVVPRAESEDVGFVACLEHKSVHQLKLRREPYPTVVRRATEPEVEAWWQRKALERQAFMVCKEKAHELKLDIKISTVRYDMKEPKAVFHFASEQRVDFRQLVKELSALLKVRIELWQIGIRDEARLVDGFGICGLQTCCSSWLKDFRPITIKMAKDQDINLPPAKLSGQCGRLLCCLSYEVDQYRQMGREALPKGATVTVEGKEFVILDRNLVARTYLVTDGQGTFKHIKADQVDSASAKVPEQMKSMGRRMQSTPEALPASAGTLPVPDDNSREAQQKPRRVEVPSAPVDLPEDEEEEDDGSAEASFAAAGGEGRRKGRRGKRGGRGRGKGGDRPAAASEQQQQPSAEAKPRDNQQNRKPFQKRDEPRPNKQGDGGEPKSGEGSGEPKRNFRPRKRQRGPRNQGGE